ncbi:syntaxin-18 [Brachionus plicatilis]|uniref:Syntaxin-18 n=1 Tax=Brachionus plicatilis TaxID=10195 RepID=A0A3M7QHM0_BRAPC|nr:syntaxin-18 [Brachionus plicatilis]
MAIDLSRQFKDNVKAIRLNSGDDKTKILNDQLLKKSDKTKKQKDGFSTEAKNIIGNITILKKFLNENKNLYVQTNYLIDNEDQMNEIFYQDFEDKAETIIKKCADSIKILKLKTFKEVYSAQRQDHLHNTFYLLEKYLKNVCKIYSQQKAVKVKRKIDMKNFSQLSSNNLTRIVKDKTLPKKEIEKSVLREIEQIEEKNKKFETELSEQELQELEKENEMLFDNLSMQTDELKKIESQVVEVSRLTQIFTENIVSQVETVDRIQKSTFETNSNLALGNENIKEAMKKNAALRLWILFIIIVLSFTLLFLDWFND